MKVVNQLIQYFCERGGLSEQQLDQLHRSGFWNPYDDYEYVEDYFDDHEVIDLPDALDNVANRLASQRRRPGRRSRRGTTVNAGEIANRLQQLEPQWQLRLRSLRTIANQLQSSDSWQQALIVIRNADRHDIRESLRRVLTSGQCTMAELSRALDWQDYRKVVRADERGPAVNAYRALLASPDYSSVGKHAWILRHTPMRQVFNLVSAKQSVLQALHELHLGNDTMAMHLRGNSRCNLFWAFVIAYNATQREDKLTHESAGQGLWPWPSVENLKRGGYYALQMAPDDVFEYASRYLLPMFDVPQDKFRWNEPANWSIPPHWTTRQNQ